MRNHDSPAPIRTCAGVDGEEASPPSVGASRPPIPGKGLWSRHRRRPVVKHAGHTWTFLTLNPVSLKGLHLNTTGPSLKSKNPDFHSRYSVSQGTVTVTKRYLEPELNIHQVRGFVRRTSLPAFDYLNFNSSGNQRVLATLELFFKANKGPEL